MGLSDSGSPGHQFCDWVSPESLSIRLEESKSLTPSITMVWGVAPCADRGRNGARLTRTAATTTRIRAGITRPGRSMMGSFPYASNLVLDAILRRLRQDIMYK